MKQAGLSAGVIGASQRFFPSWMPRLAFAPNFQNGGPGDILISIFLRGGLDGLGAVVPYFEGKHYYDERPTIAVPEPGSGWGSAIDLDGRFGLHPQLAGLKEIWDDGNLGIVHATGLTDSTRSHFEAMKFMEFGTPGAKTIGTGWLGRHLQSASWQNESPFRAVGIGSILPDSLRGPVSPLAIKSIADFHFKGREDELVKLQQSLQTLYSLDSNSDSLRNQSDLVWDTIDLVKSVTESDYVPANGAQYPFHEFGDSLREVARLVKAEVGLEVAAVDLGGWDTHEAQGTLGGQFYDQMRYLAEGLMALYADLRDYMGRITVVVMSEFGRTVTENASAGTDHGHGNAMFVLGGGVRGKQIYGDWPGLAPENRDEEGDLAITTDYRDVLAEIISQRLLNNQIGEVFPNFSHTPLGMVDTA